MKRRYAVRLALPASSEDVEEAVDVLRQSLARADAMVCAAEHQLERFTWGTDDEGDEADEGTDDSHERRLDHLAHLLGATKEAIRAAVCIGGEVTAKLVRRRRGD